MAEGEAPGQFNNPEGMTVDDKGRLWIADTKNHRIQQFGIDGTFVGVLGKVGSGPGELSNPTGVVCRGDKIYVADSGNGRIQVFQAPTG